jgi:hypothetical protein
MNIQSAQYVNDENGQQSNMLKCVIDEINMWVPIDPANRHYEEIMQQVKTGDLTIADAD